MVSFSWLHLSDLHVGMKDQKSFWPVLKGIFFEDLKILHDKCGPWDIVIFTGDLTRYGSYEEFKKVNDTLDQLWEHFHKLGSKPKLLAVPGNHDLVRPENTKDPSIILLQLWKYNDDIQEEFWKNSGSSYRLVINNAFKNYSAWWENQPFRPENLSNGIIPGDFSATIEKDGARLGVVGLNTAFLQLTGDEYKGRLALHAHQFHEVCGGDGPHWAMQHNTCLLLTHHPPAWLNHDSRQHLNGEITTHGRFAAHLCGHMHKSVYLDISEGDTEARRIWQNRSLFGLEYYGQNENRLYGYTAGRIGLYDNQGRLLFWPREARLQGEQQRRVAPDYSLVLTDNYHTHPIDFNLLQPYLGQDIYKAQHKEPKPIVSASEETALSYAEKGDYSKAVEFYENELKKFPDDIILLIKIAEAYRKTQNHEKAIECYLKVINLENDFPDALEGLALTYAEIGEIKSSDIYFQQYISAKREKILEAKLQSINKKRQELYQNEMMAALGQMASGMAHEFNTPLQAIKFIAQSTTRFMDKGKTDYQEIKDNFKRIVDVVNSMAGQVNHIQALAKDDGLKTEWIYINRIIKDAFDFFSQQLKNRSIEVRFELADNLPEIKANRYRIEQIFINLIQNSKDALEPVKDREKEIIIRTSFIKADAPSIAVFFQDNGTGIKNIEKHKIFEPFYTTKETRKGMGLGLSIVKEIVSELDGTIRLFEESYVGATFIIEIPVREKGDEYEQA